MKIKLLVTTLCFLILTNCTTDKKEKQNTKSIFIKPNAGKKWNVFGVEITSKILSEDTNGNYSVIITNTPPQAGPPMHIHEREEELFYILKGTYIFTCGNQKIKAKEGSMVRLPKGIPHNFKNIDTITGITMNTIIPGGFENFFEEIANISKSKKITRKEIDSIANSYGLNFIK